MTVTITTKHEIPKTEEDVNETCCAEKDHTNSLLKDLPKDDCKELLKHKKDKEDVSDDEDEINYEKLRQLLKIEDAPEYMQHNRFILSGYRGILPSKLCIESIFWWTNETINIWSHLFGIVLFIALAIYDLTLLKIHASASDKIIVASVLICFQLCMFLSSLYHTFSCRSEDDCNLFLSFDLFGIALSLLAIYASGIYYAFWCNQELQSFYLITITLIFVFAMALQLPMFNVNTNVKMIVFVAWAAYGVLPTLHWTYIMGGFKNPLVNLLLPRILGMYTISGIAFFIYLTKIPERFYAGKFDFLGHSHQWWHFFMLGALYYWHNTGILYVDYRLNHACPDNLKLPA